VTGFSFLVIERLGGEVHDY